MLQPWLQLSLLWMIEPPKFLFTNSLVMSCATIGTMLQHVNSKLIIFLCPSKCMVLALICLMYNL
jgi:hypothetical protein